MKQIFTHVLIFSIALVFSCKDKSTNPPDNYPPGYQHDIPWPSLADSPWPMYRCDPQNTGRSRYIGAKEGSLEWIYDSIYTQSGVTSGPDSTIYFVSSSRLDGNLYCAKYNGELKWKVLIGESFTNPTVASDGTIYVVASSKLYSIASNGTFNWIVNLEPTYAQKAIYLGIDGTIYYIGKNKLYALGPDGILRWDIANTMAPGWGNELAFSPDGKTVYVGGTGITSINIIDKKINWVFGNEGVRSLMVDCKGNIYFHTMNDTGKIGLFSLRPDKSVNWFFDNYEGKGSESYLVIDRDGNIYFDDNKKLYSLNYNGDLRWTNLLTGISSGFLIADDNGIVYGYSQVNGSVQLTAYSVKGNIIWIYLSSELVTTGNSFAVGFNRIYLPTWDSKKIYSIK